MKKRAFSLLLAMVMLLSILPLAGFDADAAKEEPKRVIGIVFDNSSSMYQPPNVDAWCRATYAMEVFASMMNEGDLMQVYPMNVIEVGAHEYTMDAPLVINGPDEAETLRRINSPYPGRTPIETVTAAYEGLMATKADERYLIVLTDGEEFYKDDRQLGRGEDSGSEMEMTELLSAYSRDMQVMYLGIGQVAIELDEQDRSCQHYDKAADSADTLKKLTAMCNIIFGREELPNVSSQIQFDVSMSKLIVFVQGEDVSNVSLEGGTKISEHATHYSERGTDNPDWVNVHQVDTTLQGMLVTYGEHDAGSYALTYAGTATSVKVYYEPDVDLSIWMVDENGNAVDPASGLSSGVYHLEYGMVDRDGNPTNSSLLGQTNYQITYTINGEEFTVNDNQAGSIELDLHGGDILDGSFDVTYLNDYSIHKDGEDLGWSESGLNVISAPIETVKAEVTGGCEEYPLSELESQAVYDVKVFYDGQQLTGSALDGAELQVELTGGNAEYDLEKTDSGFTLTLHYCGDATATDCGKYKLTITPSYTDRDGQTASGSAAERSFTISDDSSAAAAEFRTESTFFQSNKLDEAEAIELVLSLGGSPLTAEQFAKAQVEIDTAGLNCNIQADPSGSRYLIKLPTADVENGRYKLTCHAQVPNEIGRMTDVEDALTIEIQPFPQWVKLLIRILIVLLILALIWAYLNTKILPKRIGAGKCTFIVDGSLIPGSASCVFAGGNKKRGTLEITSPKYMANPAVKCGFRLELEAVSPRRTKSSARSVKVRNVTALSPNTTSIHIGSLNMIRDPNTGRLVKSGGKADAPIEFNISNNAKASVTAEVLDVVDGNEIAVSLSLPLKFF